MGVLERVGKGLISFGTGIPQAELDRQNTANAIGGQNVELNQQTIEASNRAVEAQNQADIDAQKQQELRSRAAQGDSQAQAELIASDPDKALAIAEAKGFTNKTRRDDGLRFLNALELATNPIQQQQLIAKRLADMAGDPARNGEDTAGLVGKSPEEIAQIIPSMKALLGTANQADVTSEIRTREQLLRDASDPNLDKEDVRKTSARIDLGLDPRAIGSSALTIANTPDATGAVAGSGAVIAGAIQGAKTQAQIDAELRNATDTARAEAERAALVESAIQGEKISARRIKTAEDAKVLLPDARAGAQEMVKLLTEIRDDPELPNVLGALEGRIDARIDPAESALLAKIKQVTGKTFLQAYQSLKGGGPITDREGEAATDAQSRLSTRTVSVPEYQDAIDELIGLTDSRLQRLERKAGNGLNAPPKAAIDALRANDSPEVRSQFVAKYGSLPDGF